MRKSVRWIALAIAALALVFILGLSFRPTWPSLEQRARREVTTQFRAEWISNSELYYTADNGFDRAKVFNIQTRASRPVSSLSKSEGDIMMLALKGDQVPVPKLNNMRSTLPNGAEIWEAVPSPNKRHNACIVRFTRSITFGKVINRLFAGHLQSSQTVTGIWVASEDAREVRCLGVVTYDPNGRVTGDELVRWLHWSPNGKLLSFGHNGALWTIPVE